MRPSHLLLPLTTLLLLLVGCGSDHDSLGKAPPTATRPDAFEASAGSLSFSTGTTLSTMFKLDIPAAPTDVLIRVDGPDAWNHGEPFEISAHFDTPGRKWLWQNIATDTHGNLIPLASGSYTFTTVLGGDTFQDSTKIDANTVMALPTDIRVSAVSDSVVVDWQPIEGAQSYQVNVYALDGSLPKGQLVTYTTLNFQSFTGLEMQAGTDYVAQIQAFPTDFTATTVHLPETFPTSFASTVFQIVSTHGITAQGTGAPNPEPTNAHDSRASAPAK